MSELKTLQPNRKIDKVFMREFDLNNMKKLKIPLFPESKFLKDKWWHRLAKTMTVVTIILSIIVFCGGIIFIINDIFEQKKLNTLSKQIEKYGVDYYPTNLDKPLEDYKNDEKGLILRNKLTGEIKRIPVEAKPSVESTPLIIKEEVHKLGEIVKEKVTGNSFLDNYSDYEVGQAMFLLRSHLRQYYNYYDEGISFEIGSVMVVMSILLFLIPVSFYRVFLYISFGDRWKDKKSCDKS